MLFDSIEWIDFPRGDQHLPDGSVIPGNNFSYDKCCRRFDLVSSYLSVSACLSYTDGLSNFIEKS